MTTTLPKGWSRTYLEEVVDILDNKRIPINAKERSNRSGPIPYYGATGQVGWIDDYIFDEELVLLGEDGAPFLQGHRAKAYLVHGKSWVNNHAHVLRGRGGIPNALLMYQLNWVEYKPFVSGTTRLKLPQGTMKKIPLLIPPLEEQHRIVDAIEVQLTRLDASAKTIERVKGNLKRYRASVLKAAVEGRLVPTEAELAREAGRDYEHAQVLLERILKERRRCWEEAEWRRLIEKAKQKAAKEARKKAKRPLEKGEKLDSSEWEGIEEAVYRPFLPKNVKWKNKYKEPEPVDTTGLPELPTGWVWVTPDQIAATSDYSLGIGPFGSNLKVSDYRGSGVPLIFVRNIREETFGNSNTKYVSKEKAEELRPHWAFAGDILVTKMGDPPGDACLYPRSKPKAVITADCIRWRLSKYLPNALFFVFNIRSPLVQQGIAEITKGVAQRKVSLGRFKKIVLPLPPLAEQERITTEIDRLLSVSDSIAQVIDQNETRCQRLRQSILKWAFEGKLVDQDPSDEPATQLLKRIKASHEATSKTTEKGKTRKAKKMKSSKRRSLVEVLKEANEGLTPEELMKNANYSIESIEDFYEALRLETRKKVIVEERPDERSVLLRLNQQ